MADAPAVVVDIHSHVFNAEDLPIDGFVKKLSPAPRLLTGILSRPLDALAQWVAPGSKEVERILELLAAPPGLESIDPDETAGSLLVTDAELDILFEAEWQRLGVVPGATDTSGLETLSPSGVSDDELADALASAPAVEVHELEGWLEDWDPELRVVMGLEGFGDLVGYVRSAKRAVARYVWALRLITRHRYQVAAQLARTYPTVSLFVPALVDFEHTTIDNPRTDIRKQIAVHSLVAKLSTMGRLPGAPGALIAPFVAFDPYREVAETALRRWNPDRGVPNTYVPYASHETADEKDRYHRQIRFDPERARRLTAPVGPWETAILDLDAVLGGIDLVRHAVELGGFVGVKLYPPAGFLPLGNALRFIGTKGEQLDAALRSLYAYCSAMDVPILAHAAHSNGFEPDYNGFAGPAGWELVLSEYPELRVCFGHFGHLHGLGPDAGKPAKDGWARRFVDLIDRHPHVYADVGNSKFPLSEDYRRQFLGLLTVLLGRDNPDGQQQKRRRRLLYGSDFWMNTMSPSHERFLTDFEGPIRSTFGDSTADAFMGGNALRFLGFTGEDDGPGFANRNRIRCVAFHGPHPTPAWLPAEP